MSRHDATLDAVVVVTVGPDVVKAALFNVRPRSPNLLEISGIKKETGSQIVTEEPQMSRRHDTRLDAELVRLDCWAGCGSGRTVPCARRAARIFSKYEGREKKKDQGHVKL